MSCVYGCILLLDVFAIKYLNQVAINKFVQ